MKRPIVLEINKAKVILYPIKNVRSVIIDTFIKCGSWYENPNNQGVSHFLEHILFHGTQKFPTNEDITFFIKENGIYSNAYTSGKFINFYLTTPDINLDNALTLFEETIFYPLISPEKINNELNIISQEKKSKWDRPETRFSHQIDEMLFGQKHIYTQDILGNIDYLQKISSSDLKSFHQKYFQPQNLTISIIGSIKNTSKIIQKLTKILNQQTNTYKAKLVYPPIHPSAQKTLIYNDKPEQETISMIWILQNKKESTRLEKISQTVFNNILGVGPDSLLFKIFRLKHGLVYGIGSRINNYHNCDLLEIFCQIDPQNHNKFFKIFNQEFPDIINQITQEKFNQSINYINYQTLIEYDSLKEISHLIVSEANNFKEIFMPEDYIKLAQKIDFQKTFTFFKKKLTPENRYTFIMTPIKPEQ